MSLKGTRSSVVRRQGLTNWNIDAIGASAEAEVELSRCAAGGGDALLGGVAVSAIGRALDWPAHFGHTWLDSGIWPHGHSS